MMPTSKTNLSWNKRSKYTLHVIILLIFMRLICNNILVRFRGSSVCIALTVCILVGFELDEKMRVDRL